MTMPEMQDLMLPLLRILGDGKEHNRAEVIELLARQFKLTDSERKELMSNGQHKFDNLTYWVRAHFTQRKLIENTENGHFRITSRGLKVLNNNPGYLNLKFLDDFPEG